MQRLLNIPTNQDDKTIILQAVSHLIAEKLNANKIQQAKISKVASDDKVLDYFTIPNES